MYHVKRAAFLSFLCAGSVLFGMHPHGTIHLIQGDIARQKVDAIVNSDGFAQGGNAHEALFHAAGHELQHLCDHLRALGVNGHTGSACITPSFNLQRQGVKNIIHAVGPARNDGWSGWLERLGIHTDLRNTYISSLQVAAQNELTSVAVPEISIATHSYYPEESAQIAVTAVRDFFVNNPYSSVKDVSFVVSDFATYWLFHNALTAQAARNVRVLFHGQQQPDLTANAHLSKAPLYVLAVCLGLLAWVTLSRNRAVQDQRLPSNP